MPRFSRLLHRDGGGNALYIGLQCLAMSRSCILCYCKKFSDVFSIDAQNGKGARISPSCFQSSIRKYKTFYINSEKITLLMLRNFFAFVCCVETFASIHHSAWRFLIPGVIHSLFAILTHVLRRHVVNESLLSLLHHISVVSSLCLLLTLTTGHHGLYLAPSSSSPPTSHSVYINIIHPPCTPSSTHT